MRVRSAVMKNVVTNVFRRSVGSYTLIDRGELVESGGVDGCGKGRVLGATEEV